VSDCPRWIPTSERLPEQGVEVLAFSTDGWCPSPPGWERCIVTLTWVEPTCWMDQEGKEREKVTHWMPLPNRPDTA